MISDLHVPAQGAVVGENNVIADGAVVSDMTVSEKISAIADSCFAFARRAAMCGYEFTKRIFIADFQISRFAAIF